MAPVPRPPRRKLLSTPLQGVVLGNEASAACRLATCAARAMGSPYLTQTGQPIRNKNLPKPTDKDFLLTVKEDIAHWTNCVKENSQLHCLKVG